MSIRNRIIEIKLKHFIPSELKRKESNSWQYVEIAQTMISEAMSICCILSSQLCLIILWYFLHLYKQYKIS